MHQVHTDSQFPVQHLRRFDTLPNERRDFHQRFQATTASKGKKKEMLSTTTQRQKANKGPNGKDAAKKIEANI